MPDPLDPQHCAELLGALAAPERLRIVRCLSEGSHSVTELADRLQIALVNVSHHLSVLRHARLVQTRKKGRNVLYSLAPGLQKSDDSTGCCDNFNLGCCELRFKTPDPAFPPRPPEPAGPDGGPRAK